MLSVGLTGSVASGKSTVAAVWEEAGIPVVGADDLARRVVEPGTPGLRRVVEAFGEEVLAGDGTLDRAALRDRVFHDPQARHRLESILHPLIAARRRAWVEERRTAGAPLAVAEVPLLFEAGLEMEFDVVVVVHASREERMRRLREERGLDEEEAGRIMAAQMDPEEKRRRADFVLENDRGLEDLREGSLALLERLRKRAGGGGRG